MFSETKLIDMEAGSNEPEFIVTEAINVISQATNIDDLIQKSRAYQTEKPKVYECIKQLLISIGYTCILDEIPA